MACSRRQRESPLALAVAGACSPARRRVLARPGTLKRDAGNRDGEGIATQLQWVGIRAQQQTRSFCAAVRSTVCGAAGPTGDELAVRCCFSQLWGGAFFCYNVVVFVAGPAPASDRLCSSCFDFKAFKFKASRGLGPRMRFIQLFDLGLCWPPCIWGKRSRALLEAPELPIQCHDRNEQCPYSYFGHLESRTRCPDGVHARSLGRYREHLCRLV